MQLKSFVMAVTLLGVSSLYAAEWGYGKHNGPKEWGKLDESYKACRIGVSQSPINVLSKSSKKASNELSVSYQNDSKDIVNNGHSLQVNFSQGSEVSFKNTKYKLVQLHFHTPSENKVDGKSYPLEMHLVHQNDKGELLVIAVFFQQGKENSALKTIIKNAPKKVNENVALKDLNPNALMPNSHAYYAFEGSLTTPPCSEQVQWVVLKKSLQASKQQISDLHAILHDNARNIQPLNNRKIESAD